MKSIGILFSALLIFGVSAFSKKEGEVLGTTGFFVSGENYKTESVFSYKEEISEEPLYFSIIERRDNTLEYGEKKILEKGVNGKLLKRYKVTLWDGMPSEKELLGTTRTEPQEEKILVGTKIVWKTINTPEGERKYWRVIPRVWATSYDKSCAGCDEWTALGTRLDVGTCAVDPKVIKMRTEIFVPGYGICRALDVGGAIKGNKIDVGFYDLHAQSAEVGWKGAHFTDIYLLDNAPGD
jgi:3D (Asp-Asp-Asp) domain-containing protein